MFYHNTSKRLPPKICNVLRKVTLTKTDLAPCIYCLTIAQPHHKLVIFMKTFNLTRLILSTRTCCIYRSASFAMETATTAAHDFAETDVSTPFQSLSLAAQFKCRK